MQGNGWLGTLLADLRARVQDALAGGDVVVGPLDLALLEQELQQAMRLLCTTVVELRLAARVRELGREPQVCATCQGVMRRVGDLPRVVVGLVGDYRFARPYYSCPACHTGRAPLDAELGLGSGVLGPALAEVAAYEALKGPFEEAARALSKHHGLVVDAETVRTLAEGLGQVVEADQADSAQWALPAALPVPAVLAVELDGVLLHERASWREVKGGRVAPLGPALVRDRENGEEHFALGTSTYCVGLEGATPFWQRLMREVGRAGWGHGVQTVVVVADGAEWIWHQARTQLGRPGVEVVEILDFYHASEHLSDVADAVFGPQTHAGAEWLACQCHALRHQGPAPILRALGALAPRDAPSADCVRKVVAYVRSHAARMAYPAFRGRQFPIGSGAIESTVKNLIQARQVQAGMRWSAEGAQALANLRALYYSADRWDTFWQTKPLHRLRLLPPAATPTADLVQTRAPAPADPTAVSHHPAAPAAPRADRIQSAGKPWAKGADYWRRLPLSPHRTAS